jgi:peroxiredoxin Q/BCP
MVQLRRGYQEFQNRDTKVVVIGPEGERNFKEYWAKYSLPFTGLPDPRHEVLKLYGQQVKIFKFGRMPAQVIIDKSGIVRYIHYGLSMSDIPSNRDLFQLIDEINSEEGILNALAL